jgi:hypothetical protein
MSKDEMLEIEEKVTDALEENSKQLDKVAKLHAPEIDSEDSAMEEGSQDEKKASTTRSVSLRESRWHM